MAEHYLDQFHYTPGMVAELLLLALDGPEVPARGLTDEPRGVGDPAVGGNLQAMLLDVRRALTLIDTQSWRVAVTSWANNTECPAYVLDEIVDVLGGPPA